MARIRVRAAGAIVAVAAVAAAAVVSPKVANADQTAPVTTPYVHSFPGSGSGADPTITAMAEGPDGRPWFVTADGRAGSVNAVGTTQYVTVASGDELEGLVLASDGALWTADVTTGSAVRIASDGTVTSTTIGIDAVAVAAGTGGSAWFLDADSPTVVKVSSNRTTTTSTDSGTDAAAPTAGGSGPQSLVVTPDGTAWFAPSDQPVLERVTGSGTTRIALTDVATTLTVGSDGDVWAGLSTGGVDRVTPGGSVSAFTASAIGAVLSAVTGSDGRTWIAEQGSGTADVAAITTSGVWTHYAVPANTTTLPLQLTNAPDGSIWFDQYRVSGTGTDVAARMSTAGTVTTVPLAKPVYGLTATSTGVWFGDSTGAVSIASMPGVDRISGQSRYDTSVALAEAAHAGTTGGTVYVATGTNYPDALAAGPAAAKLGGPLLLTTPTALPDVVAQELTTLAPSRVVVVGGTAAVSDHVLQQIRAAVVDSTDDVERVAGADRFDTARLLAGDAFGSGVTSAYIATGTNFPDALAAGAAAGAQGVPVVLVDGGAGRLDAATKDFLTSLGVTDVTIVGGTSAVSSGVAAGLVATFGSAHVTRVSGADRFATATQIGASAFSTASHAYLATGTSFADALAGSALAAANDAPLFTSQGNCVPAGTLQEMAQLGTTSITLIGGASVQSSAVAALSTC